MLEAVIFDYGGVISSPLFRGIGEFEAAEGYPKGSLLRLLFGEVHYVGVEGRNVAAELADEIAADPDEIEGEGEVDPPAWHRLERGELTFSGYYETIERDAPRVLGKALDAQAYGRFLASSAPGVHWMVVHKIRELRARGLLVGLLTNNVKEFGDHWRATFPIDDCFDAVVDSSHVGMRKPEPRIYELMCSRLAVAADACAFVDDNADNIAAARTLGMEAVHFGDDPWDALAELDAVVARRGIKSR